MIPLEELKEYWEEQYLLTSEEVSLVTFLFESKMKDEMDIDLNSLLPLRYAEPININGEQLKGDEEFTRSLVEIGFRVLQVTGLSDQPQTPNYGQHQSA
jgi:hypothetical protein